LNHPTYEQAIDQMYNRINKKHLIVERDLRFLIKIMRILIWKNEVTKSAPIIYRKLKDNLISMKREDIPISLSKVK
jgi:hypothetical protein